MLVMKFTACTVMLFKRQSMRGCLFLWLRNKEGVSFMTTTITEKEEVRKTLKSESKNTDGVTVVTMEASVTNMDYNTISYHVNIVNIAEYAKDKVKYDTDIAAFKKRYDEAVNELVVTTEGSAE